LQEIVRPVQIVNAFRYSVIIPEIELRKIPVKVLGVAVVIDTVDASLQKSKISFDGVGSDNLAVLDTHIFFFVVVHLGMSAAGSGTVQNGRFVGHKVCVLGDDLVYDRPEIPCSDLFDVVGLHRAAALHKREDRSFVGNVGWAIFRALSGLNGLRTYAELSADISFVALDYSAERSARFFVHCHAYPVSHKPSGLESDAQGPVNLIRAYTFFRSSHEIHGLKPVPQRNMAILENGPHSHSKRLPAGIALVQSIPSSLAVELAYADFLSAMWANRAIGPQFRLHEIKGGLFIIEAFGGQNRFAHGLYLLSIVSILQKVRYVKYNIPHFSLDITGKGAYTFCRC
jgi:hypothetical protein